MTRIAQCPECGTRFKATPAQLEANQGMVRCGSCHVAFNAAENLRDEQLDPQLKLPIELEVLAPESSVETRSKWQRETPRYESPFFAISARKQRPWVWIVACMGLLLILCLQAFYFFRVEIAARVPAVKPVLIAFCGPLQCKIPLPHDADLLTIEFSALEADPTQANVITLLATLRNHAPYAQAFPNLELTLNDISDSPVARRSFHPAEYLAAGEKETHGLPPSRDFNVKLNLDVTSLPAAGYRLLLSYPN